MYNPIPSTCINSNLLKVGDDDEYDEDTIHMARFGGHGGSSAMVNGKRMRSENEVRMCANMVDPLST